ncbi:MAG: hypothetical protein ACLP4W_23425 [Mycobacterium sp.]|uniref:hypothetical protein n=1 Tax=Mycobacterium sp. TaxID=1785 RepID=UPI003F975B91
MTLVAVKRLTANSPTGKRFFGDAPRRWPLIDSKLRRLGLRRSKLEHTLRLPNGNDIGQVDYGRLEPGGQPLLTLKQAERAATKADVAELIDRLSRVEEVLTTRRCQALKSSPSRAFSSIVVVFSVDDRSPAAANRSGSSDERSGRVRCRCCVAGGPGLFRRGCIG